jgi:beta-N-acetylhexosaminidase
VPRFLPLVAIAVLAAGASPALAGTPAAAPEPAPAATVAPEAPPATPPFDPDPWLERMTVQQKVGQLLMVGFSATSVDESVSDLVRGRQAGGVCLFKRNIVSAEQVARLNDGLRELLADWIPPFIAVDQEGGNVVRISDGAVVLPGNMALGATRSASLAYEAGRSQAHALKLLGFNMNLAPVLDVNVNPRNPVIGIRSFGDRPELVTDFGVAFVRGQQDEGLVTVAKHFPGHGNTDADSHRTMPVMRETRAELMEQIAPFTEVIHRGLDGVMTAHVAIPALTGSSELPATVSSQVVGGLLRKQIGFNGLVLTDELEMEAIAQRFGVGRAAVMSVAAGADMVLIPWRPEKKLEVYRALLLAAQNGDIPPRRLDEAVRRILVAKARRGLFEPLPPVQERLHELRSRPSDVDLRIARSAVTLIRADEGALPLAASGKRIAVITAEASLATAVRERVPGAQVLVAPAYPNMARRAALRAQARAVALGADVVIVGMINSRQLELATMASAAGRPVIVVSMGLPYLVERVPEAKAVLAVYSYRSSATEAAVASIFGEQGTPGRLPVSLSRYPFGHGLQLQAEREAPPSAPTAATTRLPGPAAARPTLR